MNKENPVYSVIVPMFNEQDAIHETITRLKSVMDSMDEPYELIFIDDGSKDFTRRTVKSHMRIGCSMQLISFSRNFGHQAAVTAGLDYANGEAIIIIDADLQDPPEVIPNMAYLWKQGFEVVYGKRKKRAGESWFKEFSAKCFYRLLQSIADIDIPVDTGDFRLIDRKVCNVIRAMDERNRYVRGLIAWVGFKQTAYEYDRDARFAGETKYPFRKMLRLALDGITGFSYKPLRIAGWLGGVLSVSSLVALIISLGRWIFVDSVISWVLALTLILFSQGLVLLGLGIAGEYIGRLFDEAKKRPVYIVREEISNS